MLAVALLLMAPVESPGGHGLPPYLDLSLGIGRHALAGEPGTHFEGALGAGFVFGEKEGFRGSFGLAVEYGVPVPIRQASGYEPPPPGVPTREGLPASWGHLLRIGPKLRIGYANEIAWGFVAASPTYATRLVDNECYGNTSCPEVQVDHGIGIGVGIGVLFPIQVRYLVGGEIGYDSQRVFGGHVGLHDWVHVISAQLQAGILF